MSEPVFGHEVCDDHEHLALQYFSSFLAKALINHHGEDFLALQTLVLCERRFLEYRKQL